MTLLPPGHVLSQPPPQTHYPPPVAPPPQLGAAQEARDNYQKEAKCWINQLRNHPSIIHWVIFNEGWGQHDTVEVTNMVMEV